MKTAIATTSNLLRDWVAQHTTTQGLAWLDSKCQPIVDGAALRVFFTAFSAVPRYVGKEKLSLTMEQLQSAQKVRSHWHPQFWTSDGAARILLLLALPHNDAAEYLKVLEQLFTTADMGELVALYQALPLLPYPEQYRFRATEGVRSNMIPVFNAIALYNPYPQDYFDELAWNQMVLKALFVGSPLRDIQGLELRANPTLGQMLTDYANERLAANRTVSPELWQLVELIKSKP
ncbi:EboA family metabolite traffic protein [Synechocystis sp. PCC 7509]|uniref:EboA family metabolite traffic protein n=1 Tax=Synechocystis sp. PCC 7509 TaxID=927677 RepID=UPI0002AC025C|nr:EboA family metabolite traffic protein [Synechocystis sp. PCC 7509]